MKIIKLDAIDSTNSFLKDLAQNTLVEDFTIVVANQQISGRGQMNNEWHSEPFKNLTFSLFTKLKNISISHQPYLNFAISIAIYDSLLTMSVPSLSIKWPNDILSGNQKLCGILIETTFTQQHIKNTVIGIGLNVNQEKFPEHLSYASSLKNILHRDFDLNELLEKMVLNIRIQLQFLEEGKFETIHKNYLKSLYKKGIPSAFKNEKTQLFFMGIIEGVTSEGKLQIQLEDDRMKEFGIKEVSLAKA